MTGPRALRAGRVPTGNVRADLCDPCDQDFWRYLYATVGEAYHWVDRLPWTDEYVRAYLADPAVSVWVMSVDDAVAGYFELRREEDASVEIVTVPQPAWLMSHWDPACRSGGSSQTAWSSETIQCVDAVDEPSNACQQLGIGHFVF